MSSIGKNSMLTNAERAVERAREMIKPCETYLEVPFVFRDIKPAEKMEEYAREHAERLLGQESPENIFRFLQERLRCTVFRKLVSSKINTDRYFKPYKAQDLNMIAALATARFSTGNCGEMTAFSLDKLDPFVPCAFVTCTDYEKEVNSHSFAILGSNADAMNRIGVNVNDFIKTNKMEKTLVRFLRDLPDDFLIMDPFLDFVCLGNELGKKGRSLIEYFAKYNIVRFAEFIPFQKSGDRDKLITLSKKASEDIPNGLESQPFYQLVKSKDLPDQLKQYLAYIIIDYYRAEGEKLGAVMRDSFENPAINVYWLNENEMKTLSIYSRMHPEHAFRFAYDFELKKYGAQFRAP